MIIFDDNPSAFYPLSLTRSIGDLRCGILKLRQRLQSLLSDDKDEPEHLWLEGRLADIYSERHPQWLINQDAQVGELLVNSRLIPSPENIKQVKQLKPGQSLISEAALVALRLNTALPFTPQSLKEMQRASEEIPGESQMLFRHIPDLINAVEGLIRQDFEMYFYDQDSSFETEPGVTVLNPYSVWLGDGVQLKPGVVLDASEGPIVIDEDVLVMPNAVIIGPAYIGKNSIIKIAAKIYPGTSIGPVCKIGGEVENCIFQAYSNKQHDGFLGHSFVGEWVNIGADTNNSDLKNTYDEVSFYSYPAGRKIDSGTMFMGCVIGDHTKLGINCSINTGTVIGVAANLWGNPLIDGFIPDFSWGMANDLRPYRTPAFMHTAQHVKQRRKLNLSAAEKELYSRIAKLDYGD
ncbi:MAG: hypothetical protein GX122_06870 [Candidatus Cloacimonetes bacterium]|nr:hypothetical protein [Candidatus Cloacimonadota bacterium]NLO12121.1 hypothetical protein [Candidatus Cloacimonadota bacterium]